MRHQTALEWRYAEEAEEWARLTQPSSAPVRRRLPRRVMWSGLLVLLVLLVLLSGSGAWLWQTAQVGLAAIESDIDAAVNADTWTERQQIAATKLVDLQGEVAVVEVQMPAAAGMPLLRQTRVYRQTPDGWQRTTPNAELWGEARRLETAHFVFTYRERDEEAVTAAAAHLERLYPTLYAAFFVGPLPAPKWVIRVDPAHTPGDFTGWQNVQDPIVVASPAIYLAPSDMTPEALLNQSIVLVLLDEFEAQVAMQTSYRPGYGEFSLAVHRWAIARGVSLWQMWASDLPLAQWRVPVVQRVFADRHLDPSQPYVEPAFESDLCAMHRLWMVSPIYLQLPFACDAGFEQSAVIQRWLESRPQRSFGPLPLTDRYILAGDSLHSTRETGLATAMEYAAASYGPERIPVLLAAMDQYGRWETLVAEVFGVSAEQFEAGWADYLATHYGIDNIQ